MTPNYKIREFEVEDSEHIIKLLDRSGLYHEPWDNKKNYMEKKKRDPDLMLVAEKDKKIIGLF